MATLNATTQRGRRSAILPIGRRYRADRAYNMKRLNAKFATDTLYGDIKSINQNTCAQIYTNKVGFSVCYPMMNAKSETIAITLQDFANDSGVPEYLTYDGAPNQIGKHATFMKRIRQYGIKYHVSSPRQPNENPAELTIGQRKLQWYRIMTKRKVPRRLWDFGLVWACEIGNMTVSSSRYANGRTPLEYITGETPDISEYLDFGFYDWVTYCTNAGLGELSIGRWLGVSHKVGNLMSYWILIVAGHVISATTVQRLTNIEQQQDEWRSNIKEYDELLKERLDINNAAPSHNATIDNWNYLSTNRIDEDFIEEFEKVITNDSIPHADDDKNEIHRGGSTAGSSDGANFINIEVGLPRGLDGEL